ncbi:MAG TPA: ABC transporter permease [Chthonomonadaceae bacterium]|nr:ABC transporter permease [Chthonomonadaceae bacterium]
MTSSNDFLTWQVQSSILYEYCEYGLLAVGMTLVILTGGIDLSVGSVLGFSATLFALLTVGLGWPIPMAILTVVAAGAALGSFSGVMISYLRMQPFIVTLAVMTGIRGLARFISHSEKVQPAMQPWYRYQNDTPGFFRWMTKALPVVGVQPAVLVFVVVLIVMAIFVARSKYGRSLYAIGGNEEAARLSGLAVNRSKIWTYALCAGFAALAGIVNACKLDLGDPGAGFAYELDAIAAVVIGGTSLAGGRGGLGLTLLGILIIGEINKLLSLNHVPDERRMMIQAVIVLIAVLIQRKK